MIIHSISSQAIPPGTRIEEFIIERVLGSGGFGITYLAKDTALGRKVVIKENLPVQFCFRDTHSLTVAPRHSHGEDAENFKWSLENFSKEAAMVASLDHSGIVRVHRSFQAFGTAYFVMPFVEGLTLDDLIRERGGKSPTFAEEELKGLLSRVLKALSYLHDRGIYHRDIKPGNLLITHEGIPVLIDFGSARQRLSERSMTVVESAGYTPFEQLQSRGNVGPWSDLYALGGTLVKAMTGQTLPKANDRVFDDPWQSLATRHELLQDHSAEFLGSIDRALALHPRDRWQDAGEWLATLAAPIVAGPQVSQAAPVVSLASVAPATSPPVPPRPRKRLHRHLPGSRTPVPPLPVVQGPEVSQAAPISSPVSVAPTSSAPIQPLYQPGEERDFDLVEGCKICMCWIPPGEFLMGSPEGELGRREDETQHPVEITRGFWMGKYPVTQAQWLAVMGTHPSNFGGIDLKTRLNPDAYQRELAKWGTNPVESVSWAEICGNESRDGDFLYQVDANAANGWSFHLPTEAEWEYGCRAGSPMAVGLPDELDAIAWYCRTSDGQTHPVGWRQSNAWGLTDMLGNVWEWCADWYGMYPDDAVTDPQGPISGSCRVLRGGGWSNDALRCRIAGRDYNYPTHTNGGLGFRLVLRSSD